MNGLGDYLTQPCHLLIDQPFSLVWLVELGMLVLSHWGLLNFAIYDYNVNRVVRIRWWITFDAIYD